MTDGRIQDRIQARAVAQHDEAHVVAHHGLVFTGHRLEHQFHKGVDLFPGTAPVLFGEREKGKIGNAPFGAGLSDCPHAFDAFCMPEGTLLAAFLGPAAVSIHYDGYVSG